MISVDITFCLFDFFYERNGMELKSAVDYLRERNPFVKEIDIYSNINYGIQKGYIRVKDGVISHGGEAIDGPELKNISKCVQEMLSGTKLKRSDIMLRLCKDYGYVCDSSMKSVVQELLKKGTASSFFKKVKSHYSINDGYELRTNCKISLKDTRMSTLLETKGRKDRPSSTTSKASVLKSTVKTRKDQASSTSLKASGVKSTMKKSVKDRSSSDLKKHRQVPKAEKSSRLKCKLHLKKSKAKITSKKLSKGKNKK